MTELILRKIIKIVATRCQILKLKCTGTGGEGTHPVPPEFHTDLRLCWHGQPRTTPQIASAVDPLQSTLSKWTNTTRSANRANVVLGCPCRTKFQFLVTILILFVNMIAAVFLAALYSACFYYSARLLSIYLLTYYINCPLPALFKFTFASDKPLSSAFCVCGTCFLTQRTTHTPSDHKQRTFFSKLLRRSSWRWRCSRSHCQHIIIIIIMRNFLKWQWATTRSTGVAI